MNQYVNNINLKDNELILTKKKEKKKIMNSLSVNKNSGKGSKHKVKSISKNRTNIVGLLLMNVQHQ